MKFKKVLQQIRVLPCYRMMRRKLELLITGIMMLYLRFIGNVHSKHIRHFLLRRFKGVDIHPSALINHDFEWWKGELKIGAGSTIGFHNMLDSRRGIEIGKNVCLASNVTIWTLHHDYNDVNFKAIGAKVTIGDYCWLCSHCIILPGVTIGEGAVVASGAVVTKDVEPWTVVGGIPAQKISERKRQKYNYNPANYRIPFA